MTVRINRVYTRSGDGGGTRLAHGRKVEKSDPRVEAYGQVDHLGATIGYLAALIAGQDSDLVAKLHRIQQELFDLGSLVARLPEDLDPPELDLPHHFTDRLEREMDDWNTSLPELKSFVLSGGGQIGSWAHVCRTTCRNTERVLCTVAVPKNCLAYVNRLSDFLFVLARSLAAKYQEPEILWDPMRTQESTG